MTSPIEKSSRSREPPPSHSTKSADSSSKEDNSSLVAETQKQNTAKLREDALVSSLNKAERVGTESETVVGRETTAQSSSDLGSALQKTDRFGQRRATTNVPGRFGVNTSKLDSVKHTVAALRSKWNDAPPQLREAVLGALQLALIQWDGTNPISVPFPANTEPSRFSALMRMGLAFANEKSQGPQPKDVKIGGQTQGIDQSQWPNPAHAQAVGKMSGYEGPGFNQARRELSQKVTESVAQITKGNARTLSPRELNAVNSPLITKEYAGHNAAIELDAYTQVRRPGVERMSDQPCTLHEDAWVTVRIFTYAPGEGTSIHDHGATVDPERRGSNLSYGIAKGRLRERVYDSSRVNQPGSGTPIIDRHFTEGQTIGARGNHVHEVWSDAENGGTTQTYNAYSPSIRTVGGMAIFGVEDGALTIKKIYNIGD